MKMILSLTFFSDYGRMKNRDSQVFTFVKNTSYIVKTAKVKMLQSALLMKIQDFGATYISQCSIVVRLYCVLHSHTL